MIQVLDDIVILTMGDREGELKTNDCITIAYADGISHVVNAKNEPDRLQDLLVAKSTFLPEFMEKLTFEEIMEIFMLEYASSSVEVYEDIHI